MPKEKIEADITNKLGDMAIRSEEIGHAADEMISCDSCGRSNPPGRSSCIYCGVAMSTAVVDIDGVSINLRRLESWENGHNVVCRTQPDEALSPRIAKLFGYEQEDAKALLSTPVIVPVGRLESSTDAETAIKHLSGHGANMAVVSDVRLKIGKPNVRLRGIEFGRESVKATAFNTGEMRVFERGEVVLIVAGVLFERRTELVTKKKGKKPENIFDEVTTSTDDAVVDLYTAEDERGWRVMTRGFDFSGLGEGKTALARENLTQLTERLRDFFPEARFSDDYKKIVGPLSEVWPLEETVDFDGLKRIGVWKSGFARSVRAGNLEQFQRFSRLQRIGG